MSVERPLALVLLAAVPLAWWLHRRQRGAAVVRVASLLAFGGAAATAPRAARRRALDPLLAMVLTAMTLLALAAAGLTFGANRGDAFYVAVDGSVSMSSRTCDAVSRSEALLQKAAPGAEPLVRALAGPESGDGLPGSLAPHLAAARAEGFPGVVLVTDAAVAAMPGVAVVGPSAGATENVAIAGASLDGEEAVVALRNHGTGNVVARVRCGDAVREVAVAGGGTGTVRFAAPPAGERGLGRDAGPRRGEEITYEIVAPSDDLAADDRLVVERRGGARRVAVGGAKCPRLAAALRAAGAETDGPGPWDLDATYGMGITAPDPRRPLLVVAPSGVHSTGDRPADIRLSAFRGGETVRGDAVVGRGEFAGVLPAPGTTLVALSRLAGGEAVWSDTDGALAAASNDLLVIAADPEDARSDWHRDPSFPAFVAAALDHLAGGPDRLVPVRAVPATESEIVHAPPATSSLEEIRAVVRPGGADRGAVRPGRWLALAAAALLAGAAALRRA